MGLVRDKFAITLLPYKLWSKNIQDILGNSDNIMSINVEMNQPPVIISHREGFDRFLTNRDNSGTMKVGIWVESMDLPKFFTEIEEPFSMLLTFKNTMGQPIRSVVFEKVKYQTHEIYEDQFSGVMYPEITLSFENHVRHFHGIDN